MDGIPTGRGRLRVLRPGGAGPGSSPNTRRAEVAELADALHSGCSARQGVEVRVLSSAPEFKKCQQKCVFFHSKEAVLPLSCHFFGGLPKNTPELSINPGKETSWPIVRFSFTYTQTSPESGGATAALFSGRTKPLSPTSCCDLTGPRNSRPGRSGQALRPQNGLRGCPIRCAQSL